MEGREKISRENSLKRTYYPWTWITKSLATISKQRFIQFKKLSFWTTQKKTWRPDMFHGGWLVGGGGKPRSQGNIGVVLGTSSYHHQPVRGGGRKLGSQQRTVHWNQNWPMVQSRGWGNIHLYCIFITQINISIRWIIFLQNFCWAKWWHHEYWG